MKELNFDDVTIDGAGNVIGRVGNGPTVIQFDSHMDTVEVNDAARALMEGEVNAAIDGTLHKARRGIVPNCMKIMRALATTGEVALIDEATGYQHHRAPDALQALISRLLRERVASWERRFSPDYYRALFRLFGWHYQGHQQNPPAVIGQITLRWVYDVIMPREIIEEIRNRKRLSDKAHQWLSEGGLALLEKQIHAVTMIARSSMTYRDFDTRCATAFGSQPLQMTLFIGALEGGQ